MLVAGSEFMGGQSAAGEAPGTEDVSSGGEGQTEASKELPGGGRVGDHQSARFGRRFKVHVAEGPAQASRSRGRQLEANEEHGLGTLTQDVALAAALGDRVARLEGTGQLKAEFLTIRSGDTPPTAREVAPFDDDVLDRQSRIRVSHRC